MRKTTDGRKNLYFITDPYFAEFVYYIMVNSPPHVRAVLNPIELGYFKSKSTIRKFAERATMERRMLMLTRLGLSWTMSFYTANLNLEEVFREIGTDYNFAKKNKDMLECMKRGELFVFGSRSMMVTQHLAEQGSHSQIYVLDYSYMKDQRALGTLRDVRQSTKMKDAEESYTDLSKLMFYTVQCFRDLTVLGGVSELHLRILLAMLGYRNTYVTSRTIRNYLGVSHNNQSISATMNNMVKNGLIYVIKIPEHPWEGRAYTISEVGIDKAMAFIKYVKQKVYGIN